MDGATLITFSDLARLAGVTPGYVTQLRRGRLKGAVVDGKIDAAHTEVTAYLAERAANATSPGRKPAKAGGAKRQGRRVAAEGKGSSPKAPTAPPAEAAAPAPAVAAPAPAEGQAATAHPWLAPVIPAAIESVKNNQDASAAALAEALHISTNKAKIVIVELERLGVIGPARGRLGREILVGPRRSAKASTFAKGVSIEKFLDMSIRRLVDEFNDEQGLENFLEYRQRIETIRGQELKNQALEGKLIPRDTVKTHIVGALENMSMRLLTDAARKVTRLVYARAKAGDDIEAAEAVVVDEISKHLKAAKDTTTRVLRKAAKGTDITGPGRPVGS